MDSRPHALGAPTERQDGEIREQLWRPFVIATNANRQSVLYPGHLPPATLATICSGIEPMSRLLFVTNRLSVGALTLIESVPN